MAAPALSAAENPSPPGRPQWGPEFVRFTVDRFADLHETIEKLGQQLVPRDEAIRRISSGNTDASGNLTLDVLEVPEDREFFLHRLYVNDGSTFDSPTTGGAISIQVDGQEEDGVGLTSATGSTGLPQVFTSSSSAAIVYAPGERVQVVLQGVTASKRITVVARGRLIRSRIGRNEP